MALPPPPNMKARKRFGQNFLVNDHIINSIVDAINPKEGEFLVEIGPGHAALTRPVFERTHALTAVELDRDLAERLRHHPFLQGLNLIEADALRVNFGELNGGQKIRVFGNLPYNITSPLIFHLLSFANISDMHFMLQKEVVERLAAGPGSKDYGRLTVMAQFHARVVPVLTVPPSSFVPPPKVMSAVVRLLPKDLSPEERALSPFLNRITTTAFAARRKTIRNSLSNLFSAEELSSMGINLDDRAEDLSLEVFVRLAKALQSKRSLEELESELESSQSERHSRRLEKLAQTSPESYAQAAAAAAAAADAAGAASSDSTVGTDSQGATVGEGQGSIKAAKAAAARRKKGDKRRSKKFEDFDFNDINADL